MSEDDAGPELPAGTVNLRICVRCRRELGYGPGQAPPGARIGRPDTAGSFARYCCQDCLERPREYWR